MNSADRKDIEACMALIEGLERENEIRGRLIEAQAAMIRSLEGHNAELESKSICHKKISNNREKTGRKPGGQPGHKGHCRKRQAPSQPLVLLPPPRAVLDDPDFRRTAKTIIKQPVNIRLAVDAAEYHADMLLSPVMHTDCTNARVNGKSAYVFVCATPDGNALYFAREKKGYEGVKGTVAEDYQGILVHDHESTFYSYGTARQECLANV